MVSFGSTGSLALSSCITAALKTLPIQVLAIGPPQLQDSFMHCIDLSRAVLLASVVRLLRLNVPALRRYCRC